MIKIKLQIFDDVVTSISKITESSEHEITVEIPEGSVLFENILNIKLLKKEADKAGKTVNFITEDPVGESMLTSVLDDVDITSTNGFSSKEVDLEQFSENTPKKSFKLAPPKVSFGFLGFVSKINFKIILILFIVLLVLGVGSYFVFLKAPEADVRLTVDSQPLIKSVEVKVVKDASNDSEKKILKGSQLIANVTDSVKTPTTGEKEIGEKASGSVKIYNKTSSKIKLKKGEKLQFKDKDITYLLDDDVEIPAKEEQTPDPANPGEQVFTLGEAKASIIAEQFGTKYNIDDGEDLEFEEYKKSELTAMTDGKIDGGSSKTVKVVAEEDVTKAKELLKDKIDGKIASALEEKVQNGLVFIKNSQTTEVTGEQLSAEVGDEADELEYTQIVRATGLEYAKSDLDSLLDELMKGFVPSGYVLSGEDRNVTAEVLGNTETTVLTGSEADIQVTIKAYIIYDIDEDKIKSDLAGKSLSEAQQILGSIKNVQNYSIELNNTLPLFQKVPSNVENIKLVVERN